MARRNRAEVVVADEIGVYPCVQRVVRRAFLCGVDPLSGNSYDHRRTWIRDRLEALAGLFGVEIAAFAVLSNHVHLPMTLQSYLELLDWTRRQLGAGTRGVIPQGLESILDRLQVSAESWLETVAQFGRRFHRAVGLADHLKAEAQRLGVNWLQGVRSSQVAFAHSPRT